MGGLRVVSSSCFEIQKLAVHKNYRRMGISNRIWEHIMEKGLSSCEERWFWMHLLWIIGPLRICLSTLSLLHIAESYYSKQGFSLIRKDQYKGYDLDVFEKIVSFHVCFLWTNHINNKSMSQSSYNTLVKEVKHIVYMEREVIIVWLQKRRIDAWSNLDCTCWLWYFICKLYIIRLSFSTLFLPQKNE